MVCVDHAKFNDRLEVKDWPEIKFALIFTRGALSLCVIQNSGKSFQRAVSIGRFSVFPLILSRSQVRSFDNEQTEPQFSKIVALIFMIQSVAKLTLMALVAVSPWLIAGNLPYARLGFTIGALVALFLAAAHFGRSKRTGMNPGPNWLWLILIVGVIYTGSQAVDLSLFGASAPPQPAGITSLTESEAETISIYPAATKIKLADLIMAVAVFLATAVSIRRTDDIVSMMATITVVGAAVSFFGILQAVSWNGELFWQYELVQGGRAFGSFVNRNNGAGFLVMALCGAIFFATEPLLAKKDREDLEFAEVIARPVRKRSMFRKWVTGSLAKLETKHLYVALAIATIMLGVLMSLSRGGILAMAAVLLLTLLFLVRTNRIFVSCVAILLIAGMIGGVVYLEQADDLAGRFGEMMALDLESTPRIAHWKDMWPVAVDSYFGTGAGTYRYFSPEFQSFEFDRVYAHAENVYLETLVEMGYLGVGLILLAVLCCLGASWFLLRQEAYTDRALGLFGLTAIGAVCLTAIFDFGLYQPANAILFAVSMGMVTSRASMLRNAVGDNEENPSLARSIKSGFGYICWVAIVVAAIWACYFFYGAESLRWVKRQVALVREHKDPKDFRLRKKNISKMESALATAAAICDDNAEVKFYQAEVAILQYQKEKANALSETVLEEIEAAKGDEIARAFWESYTPDKIWTSTELMSVNREVMSALRNADVEEANLLKQEQEVQWLKQAHSDLLAAESLSSGLPQTKLRLAQLAPLVSDSTEVATLIDQQDRWLTGLLDRPYPSAQWLFDVGLLRLNAGQHAAAAELWGRCLRKEASRAFERPVVELSMVELPMQPFFEEVLPQNPDVLIRVARNYFRDPQLLVPKRLLLIHTENVIQGLRNELTEVDYHYYLAETLRLADQYKPAIENYQLALELEPHQAVWRFELAKCLQQVGKYDEAIKQLQQCQLTPSPIFPRIKPMMDRIRRQQLTEIKTQ